MHIIHRIGYFAFRTGCRLQRIGIRLSPTHPLHIYGIGAFVYRIGFALHRKGVRLYMIGRPRTYDSYADLTTTKG